MSEGSDPADFSRIVRSLLPAQPSEPRALVGKAPRDHKCLTAQPIPVAPPMPPELRDAVRDWSNPHPDIGPERAHATQAVVTAARIALPQIEARHRAAMLEDWHEFLMPLSCEAANAPNGEDLDLAIGRIMVAMPSTPVCVLTQERVGEGLRLFRFFPRAFEIAEWLGPHIRREKAVLQALERLAHAKPTLSPGNRRDPGTEAEQAERAVDIARLRTQREAEEEAARQERRAAAARRPNVSLKGEALARLRAGLVPQSGPAPRREDPEL